MNGEMLYELGEIGVGQEASLRKIVGSADDKPERARTIVLVANIMNAVRYVNIRIWSSMKFCWRFAGVK
jgi:hypothetical protein